MPRQTLMWDAEAPIRGASAWLLAVRDFAMGEAPESLCHLSAKDVTADVSRGPASLFVKIRWRGREGALLLRTSYCPDAGYEVKEQTRTEHGAEWQLDSTLGSYRVTVEMPDPEHNLLHAVVRLTPRYQVKIPFWPVDLYPVHADGDPLTTRGVIFAGQRGPAAALLYGAVTRPALGSFFYLQNVTELNDYCEMLHVEPSGRVGGVWPELGYTPALSTEQPLAQGREVTLSDVFLRLHPDTPEEPRDSARVFLDLLAEIYPHLPQPETVYHDWPARAEEARESLCTSPDCTTVRDGLPFFNSYVGTGTRRPESLVQLTALLPLREYADWSGEPIPLLDQIRTGLPQFYDHKIRSVLRYREQDAGQESEDVDEKEQWELDSWYLYHPLANLARLAKLGDAGARQLFLDSLDYATQVAQHVDYRWPVLFRAETLETLESGLRPSAPGETDVPGLYAYIMLDAYELTGESRFLDEALLAAEALKTMNFELGYQFNNTAWGANAMLRLYKLTGDEIYLGTSYVCLASVFHNVFLWECQYGWAKHYSTFFGLTPLHDGAYLATYEEFEVFSAFHEYLTEAGTSLLPSLEMLMTEYCRHALSRLWGYCPSELPEAAIFPEPRNGHIDRSLRIPLEDIYEGWQQAGQVGQQVYGAGAPFALTVRSYHRLKEAPLLVYCDYPLHALSEEEDKLSFVVRGPSQFRCRLRLIPEPGTELPTRVALRARVDGRSLRVESTATPEHHLEWLLPGGTKATLEWSALTRLHAPSAVPPDSVRLPLSPPLQPPGEGAGG